MLPTHMRLGTDMSAPHHEKSGPYMRNNTYINDYYHLVVRRGAVGRKQFVWEIQHNDTARVLLSGAESFATMEEAHRSGSLALAQADMAA